MRHSFFVIAAVVIVAASCSKSSSSIGGNSKAFDRAPAMVKASWSKAVTCAQTNDCVGATILLKELRTQPLTPEQSAAVEASLKSVTETMYTAADRGDPAAQKAIEELKKRSRR